jgi:hypothetical protein
MLFFQDLLAVGGGNNNSFYNAPLSGKIFIVVFMSIIALIYWLCKRGKSDK